MDYCGGIILINYLFNILAYSVEKQSPAHTFDVVTSTEFSMCNGPFSTATRSLQYL